MNLSVHLQEELQAFRHLKVDYCTVHEEDKTRGALARLDRNLLRSPKV